jgi:hypothetical protein
MTSNNNRSDFGCPLCGGGMTVIPDSTGVLVRCDNPCVPTLHENVFGHGKNAKDAWETAGEKYKSGTNTRNGTSNNKKIPK